MHPYIKHLYPTFIAGVTTLAACTSPPNPETGSHSAFADADLLDRTFQIQDVAGRGVIDSSHITLTFGQDGQFSGNTGCNSVFGPYERSGATLAFGALGATKKLCAPALMNQEQAVLEVLADVTGIEQDQEGALLVITDDGRSLRGFESTHPIVHAHQCDGGVKVTVTYPTLDTARVVYQGQTFEMAIAGTASGTRYTGSGWEWRTKGGVDAYLAPLTAGESIASDQAISCKAL